MKSILTALLLISLGTLVQANEKKPKKTPPPPPMSKQEAMKSWPLDKGWTYAPGVPDSMLDVVKDAKMRRNKKTKQREVNFSHPVLVWVPEDSEKIRAMIMIVANTDSKEFGMSKPVRDVCRKHDIAVVYMRFALQNDLTDTQPLLDYLAETLEIEEFAHAPWFSFGKSSMGKHAFYPWWNNPSRVIGSISYHAETPTWPMEEWSTLQDESILHVSANGETEWGGTYFRHVRPALLNYRNHSNVLGHILVGKDIGHGNYPDVGGSEGWGKEHPGQIRCVDTWSYLALFIDKAMELRVPEGYPSEKPFELKQVDPSQGLLIKPHAIEDRFQSERHPLTKVGDSYPAVEGPQSPVNGYSKISPASGYTPPEGVPVVALQEKMGPQDWLLVKKMRFATKTDPMKDQSLFKDLRPAPGDAIQVDGKDFTWEPIAERERGTRKDGFGGIAMEGDIKPSGWPRKMSVLGYTVLEVKEAGIYKVNAGFSLAVRVQLVLNGQPIDHREVIELEPGLYPLAMGIRMDGASWGHVEPHFTKATEQDINMAKESQAAKEAAEQVLKERFANGALPVEQLILPYNEVPEAERKDYLWMADQELAEKWLWYHDVERLRKEAAELEAQN